jgi:hypothetical protein
LCVPYGETYSAPFSDEEINQGISTPQDSAFGNDFFYWYIGNNKQPQTFHKGVTDYYRMYMLFTKFNITPKRWEEEFTPEDQNAILTMLKWDSEKAKNEQFKSQSRALSKIK